MNTAAVKNTAANVLVLTGGGVFYGAVLAAGADAATLIVYDNTSAAGTVICKLSAVATGGASFTPAVRMPVSTGLYAAVTGTTPNATIVYAP